MTLYDWIINGSYLTKHHDTIVYSFQSIHVFFSGLFTSSQNGFSPIDLCCLSESKFFPLSFKKIHVPAESFNLKFNQFTCFDPGKPIEFSFRPSFSISISHVSIKILIIKCVPFSILVPNVSNDD